MKDSVKETRDVSDEKVPALDAIVGRNIKGKTVVKYDRENVFIIEDVPGNIPMARLRVTSFHDFSLDK